MVCRAGTNYLGNDKTSPSWKNWNGDVDFTPALLRVPKHGPAGGAPPTGPPYRTDPSDGLASLVEAVATRPTRSRNCMSLATTGRSRTAPSRTA